MKPIKSVIFLCLLISAIITVSACGRTQEPLVQDIVDSIISSNWYASDFVQADALTAGIIFDCDVSAYDDYAVYYTDEPAKADIIIVFKTGDKNLGKDTADFLESFIESRRKDFEGYAPLEVKKIDQSSVVTRGSYIILLILEDSDAANAALDSVFSR